MKIALKDIKPNPHRNLERYPLIPTIVDQLVRSIQGTEVGFWDNVLVRKSGDFYELAYGHHRLEAARQAGLKEVDFIVKKLSDEDMLRVMALENEADCHRTQSSLLIESVEALVRAIAAGTITVELPERGTALKKDNLRIAPSFIAISRKQETSELDTDSVSNQFNPLSIAQFLGKATKNGAGEAVRAVVDALELCELKVLKRVEVDNTPTITDLQLRVRQGWVTYDETQRQKRIREQQDAQKEVTERLRKEAEARLKESASKAAEARKISDALIEEEAETERLAKEARRQEDDAVQKRKFAKEAEDARIRRADEEKRAQEREKKFKQERLDLEAKVEARRQREAAMKARIAEKRAKPAPPPRIYVEEPVKFSETEVLQAGEKSQQWAQTMLDRSRAMKQKDTLLLKRIKDIIEVNQKIWSKLAVKFENA